MLFYLSSNSLFGVTRLDSIQDISNRFVRSEARQDTGHISDTIFYERSLLLYKEDQFQSLWIRNNDPITIWIAGKLWATKVDSITLNREEIYNHRADSIKLVVQSQQEFVELAAAFIAPRSFVISIENLLETTELPMVEKQVPESVNFVIIATLIVLLFIAINKMVSTKPLFKMSFGFGLRETENENLFQFGPRTLFHSIYLSFLGGLCYWCLCDYKQHLVIQTEESLGSWFYYTLILFCFLVLKYLLTIVFSEINELKSFYQFQFGTFVKFYSIISLAFLTMVSINFWIFHYDQIAFAKVWGFYFIMAAGIFSIYLFLYMASVKGIRKMRIIAYLCSTEFIGAFLIALALLK